MKRRIFLIVAVLVLVAGWFAGLPFLADSYLAEGERVRETDVEADRTQAAGQYEAAAMIYGLTMNAQKRGECLFWQAWLLEPHHNSKDGNWDTSLSLFEAAVKASEAAGDDLGLARALSFVGHVFEPGHHPDGAWLDALAYYQQAISAFARCHEPDVLKVPFDADLYARSLYSAAYAVMPPNNENGNWDRAAGLYARAAQTSRKANFAPLEAQSTHQQAFCMKPEHNPNGNWGRAATFFAEAARIRQGLGDIPSTALSLHEQAYCLVQGRHEKMTPEARSLFARAAALRRQINDAEGVANSESWLK